MSTLKNTVREWPKCETPPTEADRLGDKDEAPVEILSLDSPLLLSLWVNFGFHWDVGDPYLHRTGREWTAGDIFTLWWQEWSYSNTWAPTVATLATEDRGQPVGGTRRLPQAWTERG